MLRQRYDLDGVWDFIYDGQSRLTLETLDKETWQQVIVPMPWQPQLAGLEESTGAGWYRKQLMLDRVQSESTYILHVGAAYHYAQVWLNGHYLGEHEGGWLPFEFVLDDALHLDKPNTLVIRVVVPNNDRTQYPDFPISEVLHGKQSWYGVWGGLWQSVYVERRSTAHIQSLNLQMDADNGSIIPTLHLNQFQAGLRWRIDLFSPDGTHLDTTGGGDVNHIIESENLSLSTAPQLWSPEHPALYTVRVRLFSGDTLLDELSKTSGFRTIETQDGKILLNGSPFYMRGALDQDYYPDTLATPPSEAFLRDQFQKAKAMGFNTIRYHIKIADPRYYQLADEIGLLLWVDLPNWTVLSDATKVRVKTTLEGMIQRDGHHPSIAIWTIVNEDWGTDLVHNAADRQWLKETYHWLKSRDSMRLVVDNSPCEPSFHIESDIADYHYYRGIPDHAQEWDSITRILVTERDFIYSPNGDAIYTGDEPIIVSEFGNWGLPDVDNLLDDQGHEPWWFETGQEWAEGIVYPHGIKRRFTRWHLDRVFGSFESLTEQMQWQQYRALKYEIESLRSYPQIQGYVVTELTDVHWENNGMMDMQRKPRMFAPNLARLNANDLVLATTNRRAYRSGDAIEVTLKLSNLGHAVPPVEAIEWKLGDKQGQFELSQIVSGLNHVGQFTVHYATTTPEILTLKLYLRLATGDRQLSNEYEIPVYPVLRQPSLSLCVDDEQLRPVFSDMGYSLVLDWDAADAVVVSETSERLSDYVAAGGCALLVANHDDALPRYESGYVIYQEFPFARIMDRKSTIWNGDWVSSFSWLSPEFRQMGSPLLDQQFTEIMPEYVLTGFLQSDALQDISAGLFVGWVQRPVTLLGYRRYHQGKIALTTFRLASLDTDNPAQQHLVHTMLEHLLAERVKSF